MEKDLLVRSGIRSVFSILKIVIWWVVIYSVLTLFEMRFAPENYVVQILLATIFFLNSMVSVPFNEERILVLRLLNVKLKILGPGTYFFPFLGFWGKIYIPPEYQSDGKIVHIDTRLMRTHKIKSWKEDLLVTFMTTFFPMAKKFSIWNLFFCLILGSAIGFGAVKIKREFFPDLGKKEKREKSRDIRAEVSKSESNVSTQAQSETNNSKVEENSVSSTYNNSSNDSESKVWYPDKPFYEGLTWDNITVNDKYSVVARGSKNISSVNVRGVFTNSSYSKNYYPSMYIDGFNETPDFFCKFFTVYIRKIELKNGQTWTNREMELCDYINFVKSYEWINNECFREIEISFKPQFVGKYRWHIIDAGWSHDKNNFFKIYLEDGQYVTSVYETERWEIVRYNYNNSSSQNSETQPEKTSKTSQREETSRSVTRGNYDSFVRSADITFVPHLILKNYPEEEIAKYLFSGYYFTGIKLVDGEEIFRITDTYGNVVPEMYCFSFVFAYQGRLYDSYDRSVYKGGLTESMKRDAHLSLDFPKNVYVINGRAFYFYGSPYY